MYNVWCVVCVCMCVCVCACVCVCVCALKLEPSGPIAIWKLTYLKYLYTFSVLLDS